MRAKCVLFSLLCTWNMAIKIALINVYINIELYKPFQSGNKQGTLSGQSLSTPRAPGLGWLTLNQLRDRWPLPTHLQGFLVFVARMKNRGTLELAQGVPGRIIFD